MRNDLHTPTGGSVMNNIKEMTIVMTELGSTINFFQESFLDSVDLLAPIGLTEIEVDGTESLIAFMNSLTKVGVTGALGAAENVRYKKLLRATTSLIDLVKKTEKMGYNFNPAVLLTDYVERVSAGKNSVVIHFDGSGGTAYAVEFTADAKVFIFRDGILNDQDLPSEYRSNGTLAWYVDGVIQHEEASLESFSGENLAHLPVALSA